MEPVQIDWLKCKLLNTSANLKEILDLCKDIQFKEKYHFDKEESKITEYISSTVQIKHNERLNEFLEVNFSSYGLSQIDVDLSSFLRWILENGKKKIDDKGRSFPASITRIDFAVDDKEGFLSPKWIFKQVIKKRCQTKLKSMRPVVTWNNRKFCFDEGFTFYMGERENSLFIRFYDKLAKCREDKIEPPEGVTHTWNRMEFELKDKLANEVTLQYLTNPDFDFREFIRSKIDFKSKSIQEESPKNRWRLEPSEWWLYYLGEVEKKKVVLPKEHYTLEKFTKYVEKRMDGTLATYSKIHGFSKLKDIIEEKDESELNKKHKKLIEEHGSREKEIKVKDAKIYY